MRLSWRRSLFNVNDAEKWAVVVAGVVGVIFAFFRKLWQITKTTERIEQDNAKLRDEQRQIWLGTMARGFLEAQSRDFIVYQSGSWYLGADVREVYAPVHDRLRGVYRTLKRRWEREPTDAEIGYYVEVDKDLRQWMLEYGCPQLGLNQYGCLAVAAVYSREKTPQPPPPAQNGAK